MNMKKYLLCAVLLNIVVFAVVLGYFIVPSINSVQSGAVNISLLETRYALETKLLEEYEGNRLRLREIKQGSRILRYEEITQALADINNLSTASGLSRVSFMSFAPTPHYMGADTLYEVRVRAVYAGSVDSIFNFISDLDDGPGNIFGLAIESRDGFQLSLEFSLFGN